MDAEVKAEVEDAYSSPRNRPDPDPAELYTDVYAPDASVSAADGHH